MEIKIDNDGKIIKLPICFKPTYVNQYKIKFDVGELDLNMMRIGLTADDIIKGWNKLESEGL